MTEEGNGKLSEESREQIRDGLAEIERDLDASLEQTRESSEKAGELLDRTRTQSVEFDSLKVRLDRTLDESEKRTEHATQVLRRSRLLK